MTSNRVFSLVSRLVCVLCMLFSGVVHATADKPPLLSEYEFDEVAAMQLSDAAVAQLESKVAKAPDDITVRSQLVVHFSRWIGSDKASDKTKYEVHLLYVITRAPRAHVLSTGFSQLYREMNTEAYDAAAQQWREHVKAFPSDAQIASNAAHFFLLQDKNEAEKYLQQAHTSEPKNPEWCRDLAHFYSLEMHDASEPVPLAQKALKYQELAYSLSDENSRLYVLNDLPEYAFESGDMTKAKTYAEQLLEAGAKLEDWNKGNALHHGNLILGRIALQGGDVSAAKKHLLEAGKTPGSPQLNSFGPNMRLAKALIEKGERDTVLQYFELCAKFWDREELKDWAALVKDGRMPDFGANLNY